MGCKKWLLIFIIFVVGCITEKTINNINFENEVINNNMSVAMYYIPPGTLTIFPLSIDDLKLQYWYKINISNTVLKQNIDDIKIFDKFKYEYIDQTSKANIRLHCEFITKNKKIFSFSIGNTKLYINNKETKEKEEIVDHISKFVKKCLPCMELLN